MALLCALLISSVILGGCLGDPQDTKLKLDSVQVPTAPPCINCWPWKKTTTRHTTTLHTSHTTTPATTARTNHTTTTPATTTHANHTTAHTNHTTTPSTTHANHTTAHTTHTTTPSTTHANHTTAHTTHTTTPATTAHANHTTAHTIHTTTPATTAHANHTTAHANHTTASSTTPHANHTTTPQPTSAPAPSEYFANGTSGVCLRIKANFLITLNISKIVNVTIPPKTEASGNCGNDTAELTLTFPQASLTLAFRQDKKENKYHLGVVNITIKDKDPKTYINSTLEAMSTPLGRSFACEVVEVKLTPAVTFVLTDVKAQAFELAGGNYGTEYNCANSRHNNTVPIVVGIVLLVLIIVVVLAYVIARQRRHRDGYQTL